MVKGIVDTSAERKLLINSANNATEELGNNETSRTEVKNKIMSVVNAIMSEEGLFVMRTSAENFDLFQSFVNYCLVHFTTSMNWRYKASNLCISEIFTESDEALCILLLENSIDDYKKMYEEERRIDRKEANPRYTKVSIMNQKFQGWNTKGIKRFNFIVKKIKECREMSVSKEMEMKLKMTYARITGEDEVSDDSDDSNIDSDNDENNEHAYDGFAGLEGVSNVTGV